jgi:hypothetical protein
MYPPPKRRWPGLLGAYVVLFILLALPAVPIYYFVEPAYKLLVLRVCMAVVLAFTLYRMVQEVRLQLERQPRTDFEAAARPPAPALFMAPQFAKLRDEVTNSVRSQSYFDHVLRRRLLALLERHLRRRFGIGVADLGEPPPQGLDPALLDLITRERPRRRLPRRGISLRRLRAVVQMVEDLR